MDRIKEVETLRLIIIQLIEEIQDYEKLRIIYTVTME